LEVLGVAEFFVFIDRKDVHAERQIPLSIGFEIIARHAIAGRMERNPRLVAGSRKLEQQKEPDKEHDANAQQDRDRLRSEVGILLARVVRSFEAEVTLHGTIRLCPVKSDPRRPNEIDEGEPRSRVSDRAQDDQADES
jgi:hypothetical protein